jgi:hypothetical protein
MVPPVAAAASALRGFGGPVASVRSAIPVSSAISALRELRASRDFRGRRE